MPVWPEVKSHSSRPGGSARQAGTVSCTTFEPCMMCTCVRSTQVWSQRQEDSFGSVQRVLQQVSCGWAGHSEFTCSRLCSHRSALILCVCVCVTHCLTRLFWPTTRHSPRVRTLSHSTVPQQRTTPPHLNCCSSHARSPRPPCTLTFLALSHSLARLPARVFFV